MDIQKPMSCNIMWLDITVFNFCTNQWNFVISAYFSKLLLKLLIVYFKFYDITSVIGIYTQLYEIVYI